MQNVKFFFVLMSGLTACMNGMGMSPLQTYTLLELNLGLRGLSVNPTKGDSKTPARFTDPKINYQTYRNLRNSPELSRKAASNN